MAKIPTEDKSALFLNAWLFLAPSLPVPEAEYNFDKYAGRRHRFDWAFIEDRIGVEVDGGTWLPHGGRHGMDADRVKLNLASELGWLVFRYSTKMLRDDPAGCVAQVMRALENQR